MAADDETIELTPLLPLWRSVRAGLAIGAAIGVGLTIWRVSDEGSAAWAGLAFAVTALVFAALMTWYLARSL